MSIVYECDGGLYINVTNECMNRCEFCIRNGNDSVGDAATLWLDELPSSEEIVKALLTYDISSYREIVFCGFGEPLIEIDTVVRVAREIRELTDLPVRVNTNGLSNVYHNRDVTLELRGLVDRISISLNAKNARDYDLLCQSEYGEEAFGAVLDFIRCAKESIPDVTVSVLDLLKPDDIEACRKIAEDLGVKFRVRQFIS